MEIVQVGGEAILLIAAFFQGRVVGQGDVWAGLGYYQASRRPVVVLMAVLIAAYAVADIFRLYEGGSQAFSKELGLAMSSPWLTLYDRSKSILFEPVVEELYFRGWLWTGLRKHWRVLPTAAFTGASFLVIHFAVSFRTPIIILPVAIILSVARHFGGVRASIALNVLYNSIIAASPWVLKWAGLV